MATALRAGLIGLGMMGRHHARVLRELDGVDLVARRRPRPATRTASPAAAPVLPDVDDAHRARASTTPSSPCPTGLPRGGRARARRRPACTRWSRSRSRRRRRVARRHRRGVRRPRVWSARSATSSGSTRRCRTLRAPARGRRARRDLPDRHPAAGPVPRRGSPTSGSSRTSPPTTSTSPPGSRSSRTLGLARRPPTSSGREHEDLVAVVGAARRRHGHQPPGQLALADEGARHRRHRRARRVRRRHAHRRPHVLRQRHGPTPSGTPSSTFRGVTEGDVTASRSPSASRCASSTRRSATRCSGEPADIVTMAQGLATVAVAEALLRSAQDGHDRDAAAVGVMRPLRVFAALPRERLGGRGSRVVIASRLFPSEPAAAAYRLGALAGALADRGAR